MTVLAGCWPDGADGTDINNCCMSNSKTLMASADDYGKVNLYEYPSIQPSVSREYSLTCLKQAVTGTSKIACLRQVLA